MGYLYITAIIGMDIKEKIKKPIKVGEELYLTNNSGHFIKSIKPEQSLAIGSLEANWLFNGNPVIYSNKPTKNKEESHTDTIKFMRDCLAFLCMLWIEKDNSLNVELGFAIKKNDGHVHSNSLSYNYWNCHGKKKSLELNSTGLKKIYTKFGALFAGMGIGDEPEHTMQRKEIGRAGIGINFLQQARATNDLGIKIANYCSLFETFLSTTNVELSHQMAERAAFYLRTDPADRLDLYKKCKKAYGVRSQVVHGAKISAKTISNLVELSEHCDEVARQLIIKYLFDKKFSEAIESSDNSKLDTFFINKIFGILPENA